MATVRWNISVPAELDKDLRKYLARSGQAKKGGLSRFVGDAVNWHLFDELRNEMAKATAHLSEEEVAKAVNEALALTRKQRAEKRKRKNARSA